MIVSMDSHYLCVEKQSLIVCIFCVGVTVYKVFLVCHTLTHQHYILLQEVQYLKEQLSRHTTGKSGVCVVSVVTLIVYLLIIITQVSMELNRTKENLHRVTQV